MLFLPATLLALAVLQVSAIPIDKYTCDPSRLSLILNPNWATSPAIHSYCSALFSPSYNALNKPELPALEISVNASPPDVRKACECIVAMPLEAVRTTLSTQQDDDWQTRRIQAATQQQAQVAQKQQIIETRVRLLPVTAEQEVRIRGGLPGQPFGRGALPVPRGSELKGFGARDNLYVRGGQVDGTRNRGT